MAAFETGVSIIAGTGGIIGVDFATGIDAGLKADGGTIGAILQGFVETRTHILTGALQGSMTHMEGREPDEITFIYAQDMEQIQAWNRIYVQYQEGGLLGAPTWTNSPVEMFFQTADNEGPLAVEAWAASRIQDTITNLIP